MKINRLTKKQIHHFSRTLLWFLVGATLAAFLISSFAFIIFQKTYANLAYPGITVAGVNVARMNRDEIQNYFIKKNQEVENTKFIFTYEDQLATASAKDLGIGLDEELMAEQALSVGRSNDPVSNMSIVLQS